MNACAVVDANYVAYNAQDLEALGACYGPDCVVTDLAGAVLHANRDAFFARLAKTFADNPQNRAWCAGRVAAGDIVVDRECGERAPGGQSFDVIAIYTVKGGRIVRLATGN